MTISPHRQDKREKGKEKEKEERLERDKDLIYCRGKVPPWNMLLQNNY